jgi:hypothetical protein
MELVCYLRDSRANNGLRFYSVNADLATGNGNKAVS